MSRPAVSGLKYREGLCLVCLRQAPAAAIAQLSRRLAREQVNLVLSVSQAGEGGLFRFCLCLDQEHAAQAQAHAAELAQAWGLEPPQVASPVVLVTIYPLGPGFSLAWEAVTGLAGAGFRPLALASSLSALALALPAHDLEGALSALAQVLDLPPGVMPESHAVKVVQVPQEPGKA